jgi:hypothetical protein
MTGHPDLEERLTAAMRTAADAVTPPVGELVRGARARGVLRRRTRSRLTVGLAAGVGVVAAAGLAITPHLVGGPAATTPSAAVPSSVPGPAGTCAGMVQDGPLPSWAGAGFSNPQGGGTPYVVGVSGNIAAILFVPLSSPEAKDHANKVLWVSRADPGFHPLLIDATLAGTSTVVHRSLSGVGPSYVDLPKAGCWHLQLSWDDGQQHDSLDLVYSAPS